LDSNIREAGNDGKLVGDLAALIRHLLLRGGELVLGDSVFEGNLDRRQLR
jgi:hypothetical protein